MTQITTMIIKPVSPKGNQSWIFIRRTDAEVEAPILWPPDAESVNSFENTLMLGKTEGRKRRGLQRMRWLDSITDSMDMNLSMVWEMVQDREAWHATVHGVTVSQIWLSACTTASHDGVITHLQPDILECEVKGALGSITMNKASGSDGIAAELFQIQKDDAVKVLHSICQQMWKAHQWP